MKRAPNTIKANTNRGKAWKVMRAMITFTATDVAITAGVPYENIKHFIQCLIAAKYVRMEGHRAVPGRSGTDRMLRLVKNTGPRCPIQKSLRWLFDPNNNTYWCEADTEANTSLRGSAIQGNAGQGAPLQGEARQGGGVRPSQKFIPLLCPRKKKEGTSNVA